jgi:hypothetical protein
MGPQCAATAAIATTTRATVDNPGKPRLTRGMPPDMRIAGCCTASTTPPTTIITPTSDAPSYLSSKRRIARTEMPAITVERLDIWPDNAGLASPESTRSKKLTLTMRRKRITTRSTRTNYTSL